MSTTLLRRAAQGEAAAIETCVERFGPLVWTLVRSRLADRGSAQELCRSIFERLWTEGASHRPERESESAFVTALARRVLRESRVEADPPGDTQDADPGVIPGPPALAPNCPEVAALSPLLSTLTPGQRQLLDLSLRRGWSPGRIAEHLCLAPERVARDLRELLDRARRQLSGPLGGAPRRDRSRP